MTDIRPRVLVPYAEFLEHREQRQATAAERERQDIGRTIDTEAIAVAAPSANEGAVVPPDPTEEPQANSSSPAHNAERIT